MAQVTCDETLLFSKLIEQRDYFSKKNVIILNYLLQTIILGGWTSRSLRNTVDFLDTETLILNLLLDGR